MGWEMTSTPEPQDRASRAARNQSLFRDVNERVREINGGLDSPRSLDEWLCECADNGCTARIALTIQEYERVRDDPTHFIVAPDHVFPEVERVIERQDDYWVVEKLGQAAAVAEELDPRSEGQVHERATPAAGVD